MNQPQHIYFWRSDPDSTTYDIHELFMFYNSYFFHDELSACTVRWTKRMTLCAGTCKYEAYGSSTISLSEPLLKFRSNNQLKQTLLHEMIHAYLFKTDMAACQVDNGHGPAFIRLMEKINKQTRLNISVYHNFHDEVKYYRQHIWRCNGRCRDQAPHYGYVKRSMNRPPQQADHWFAQHRRTCGGEFIKISQPDKAKKNSKEKKDNKDKNDDKKPGKKAGKKKARDESRDHNSWGCGKPISQYIREMQENKQRRSNKQAINSEESKGESESMDNFSDLNSYQFSTDNENNIKNPAFEAQKAKTIQQYFQEIRQERAKQERSKQPDKS